MRAARRQHCPLLVFFDGTHDVQSRLVEQEFFASIWPRWRRKFVGVRMWIDSVPGELDRTRERQIVQHANTLYGQWFDNVFIVAFVIVDPDSQQPISKYLGFRDVQNDGSLARFIEDGWTKWRRLEAEQR